MLASKLRGARERKRATGVKVEGRKSHQEMRPKPSRWRASCTASVYLTERLPPNCSRGATAPSAVSRFRPRRSRTCWKAEWPRVAV